MMMASGLTRWGSVPAVVLLMGNPALATARVVFAETEIDAPIEKVFAAWAAQLGDAAVLASEPNALLTVQWHAPAAMAAIAAHRTVVTLTFERHGDDRTLFTLTHAGFGKGAAWDEALAWFAQGWPAVVAQMKGAIESAPSA